MIKKVLSWLAIAFVVFFVITRPESAAATVKGIGAGLIWAGEGIGDFFSNLVS